MTSQRRTWVVAGALVAAVVVWNVTRGADAPRAASADASGTPRTSVGDVAPFWWTFLGAESTASAWFGPPIELGPGERGPGERVRLWTLVCTHPGTEEPLMCLQGSMPVGDASPIGFKNAFASFELRPLDGWTWGQVASKESLEVRLEGFQ